MTAPSRPPVIVGVDGGPAAEDALVFGRWAAMTLAAPLVVAVVHPAPSALGAGRVDAEWVADRHRAARQVLDEARTFLAGVAADYRTVASSSAAHGLHDLAEETGASAIVVGRPGSTADRLLSGSVCPIAVAPADYT